MKRYLTVKHSLIIAGLLVATFSNGTEIFEQTDIFISGENNYDTYRIPALIATPSGTLLAFCEGRVGGRSDSGDIDLVIRRSSDLGKTWSQQEIVWNDGPNTCGNPCPVVDQETGAIWLLMTHNLGRDHESEIVKGTSEGTRTVWVSSSIDDGMTWSEQKEITSTTKKPNWSWYATGPGVGIQLAQDPYKGRLVIPCDFKTLGDETGYHSHIIFSDDHGETWQIGGISGDGANECQVIERADGTLLLNMRNSQHKDTGYRAVSLSNDGGESWSKLEYDKTLIEPRCQASVITIPNPDAGHPPLALFSNPASTKRERMTVRLSRDEGETWPVSKLVHEGSSAYSCLAPLADGSIGLLYERDNYGKITFARFTLDWLASGD